jgi:hypothetical protein
MRYLLLIALNLPVILIALVNALTQYKLKKTTKRHFTHQLIMWFIITLVLCGSFPVYNLLTSRPIFQSDSFSTFDIAQTTAIIYLIYLINHQRQRIDQTEKTLRELHQEISIKLSKD